MYQIRYTRQFEKDIRSCKQKGLSLDVLWDVVELLEEDGRILDTLVVKHDFEMVIVGSDNIENVGEIGGVANEF